MDVATLDAKLSDQLEAIEQHRQEHQAEYRQAYYELVRIVADNGDPDPDEALVILSNAGRTAAQLVSDAELMTKRCKLAEISTCNRDSNRVIEQTSEEIARLATERQATYEKLSQQINHQAGLRGAAMDLCTQATQAKAELISTAWPYLLEAERACRAELSELGGDGGLQGIGLSIITENGNLTRQLELVNFDNSKPRRGRGGMKFVPDEVRAHAKLAAEACRKRIAQLESRKKQLQEAAEEILGRIEQINLQKLIP